MAPDDAHNARLLSPKLGDGSPTTVQLGDLAAYRYDGLEHAGRKLTVYAAPTSAGVATVACLAPAPDCDEIAKSLQVHGAKPLPLGPDPAFAAGTARALTLPNRLLAVRTPDGQARVAKRIAADYGTAATSVSKLEPGPADEQLQAELRRHLRAAQHAYRALGDAAAADARTRYATAAKRAHSAELAVRRTLRSSVYRDAIDLARPRTIPKLRHPPSTPATPTPAPTPNPGPQPTPRPGPQPTPTPAPKRPDPGRCDFNCPRPSATPTEPDFGEN
jgi:hypothetical protein